MNQMAKRPATATDRASFQQKHGNNSGVSLARDDKGVFVHTHRARSGSYPSADKIPKSVVKRIESTG